jgi:hypothetical protein
MDAMALAQTPSPYFSTAFDNPALDRPSQTSPQRTTKIPTAIRKATPVIAEVRNQSLSVTAHALVPVS